MATQLANTILVLDALADSLGKTLDVTQKTTIVEEFINDVGGAGTNEEKATAFNSKLVELIRKIGRAHAKSKAVADGAGAIAAAVDAAESNNLG